MGLKEMYERYLKERNDIIKKKQNILLMIERLHRGFEKADADEIILAEHMKMETGFEAWYQLEEYLKKSG